MNNRKISISIIAVLVIAIVSLGVAFAAFSTTLNINGSAAVEATSWDIFFTTENDGAKPTQETTVPNTNIDPHGTATNNSATILATTFNWNANFKSPGDKIIYTIYVKNGGNYNAQVSSINTPQISCSNDTKNACQQLSYGLYTDTAGNTPLSTSFTVNAGATEVFYLIAELSENYGGNGSGLVTSDITTSTISATVTFEQTSSAVSNSGGNSGGNGEEQETDFLVFVPSYNDEELGSFDADWGTMALLKHVLNINTVPIAYLKIQDFENDEIFLCVNTNSTELCFSENDVENLETSLPTSCSTLGFTSIDTQFDDGLDQGTRCTNEDGAILQAVSESYADGKRIDFRYDSIYCYLGKNFSEESNQYELEHYDCWYDY